MICIVIGPDRFRKPNREKREANSEPRVANEVLKPVARSLRPEACFTTPATS
jgi:hypothetical protein